MAIQVRAILPEDREWLRQYLLKRWGSEITYTRGVEHNVAATPGLLAVCNGDVVGVLTYTEHEDDCEILCLNALREGKGVGSLLVETFLKDRIPGERITVSVYNDNLVALGFLQHLGFRLVSLLPGSVDEARRKNPAIPLVGARGIIIHDEIVLAQRL